MKIIPPPDRIVLYDFLAQKTTSAQNARTNNEEGSMYVFFACSIIFLSTLAPFKGFAADFFQKGSSETLQPSSKPLNTDQQQQELFKNKMIGLVRECVDYNNKLEHKEDIFDLLNELQKASFYLQTGSDDFRAKFVHAQASFEHIMACSQALGDIIDLVGVIHTPTPTTPLCIQPEGPISQGILDESIRWDLDKLLTVRSRAEIVREYLHKGGSLYVAYPQGGFQKRALNQQNTYKEALKQFNMNLFDTVLNCTAMHPDMIGATYLFKTRDDQVFAFSLKARQANDVQKSSEWGIWFGPVDSPEVANRISAVCEYLKANDGPDLQKILK